MMLEQFLKSILVFFNKEVPMQGNYIQKMPKEVEYPCYLVNKVDVTNEALNSFYFINNVTPYIRMFGHDEVALKNSCYRLQNHILKSHRMIPILNKDGTESDKFIRVEGTESIEIMVDEPGVYCQEINFEFFTTHHVYQDEFELIGNIEIADNVQELD